MDEPGAELSGGAIPGDEDWASRWYRAFVGPEDAYDLMGASQFRLLCALGLRDRHRLLDFGCGSLRAGRLFIPYLEPGNYYGIEPNRWLVEEGIQHELGTSIVEVKRPNFLYHDTFTCREFGVTFDYILAQSIFSHCGPDLIRRCLAEFAACLAPEGIAAVTFFLAEDGQSENTEEGWVYPDACPYRPATVQRFLDEAGLLGRAIPWYHWCQQWYVLSRSPDRVPSPEMLRHLSGAVLFNSEIAASWPLPA